MSSSSVASLPITVILVLLGSLGLIVGIPVLLVGLSTWFSTRKATKRSATDSISNAAARQARIGRIGGLIMGAVVGVATWFATDGILAPAFVGVGYLLGMLAFELQPSNQPIGPIRSASLQARNAWQYLPRWVVRTTIVIAFPTLVAPVVFVVAPPPSYVSRAGMVELSLPFAVMAAAALAVWVPLMNKVARLPQPVTEGSESNRVASSRANAARAVTGAVLGIEMLSLAGVTWASSTLVDSLTHGKAYALGRIMVCLGVGLAIAGLIVWSILSRWRSVPAEPADPALAKPRIA
jgi:hypothetical protein